MPYDVPWTFDTGLDSVATGAPATVKATPGGAALGAGVAIMLAYLFIQNTNTEAKQVKVTDGSGVDVVPEITVPPGGTFEREFPMRPLTGLKAGADVATGIVLHAWGWLV